MTSSVIQVKRVARNNDGVFGVLTLENKPICVTLELPWLDNQRRISCIPSGNYSCKRHSSAHLGECWEITNVPNRTAILIHGANLKEDLLGCIGVAEMYQDFAGRTGIANPFHGAAFQELMKLTHTNDELSLFITEHF